MREVVLDGLSLAYAQAGHGPPLVLLHGGVSDSRSWRRQLDGLSDEFMVLAWDGPGWGRSSDVPEDWRLADYAKALGAWLAALRVEQAHVLGLSWGSSVALEFYRRFPSATRSLILASAYAGWAGSLPADEVKSRAARALAAADVSGEDMLDSWPGLFGPRADAEVRREELAIAAENHGARHPGGYRATVRSMAEADLRDMLPHVRVPTLLLYGELDERSPLGVAHALHAAIPGSELAVIPGAGHMTQAETPAEFNAHVRRFVRQVESRRAATPGAP